MGGTNLFVPRVIVTCHNIPSDMPQHTYLLVTMSFLQSPPAPYGQISYLYLSLGGVQEYLLAHTLAQSIGYTCDYLPLRD